MAAGDIDDRKPTHSYRDGPVDVGALVVRAAVDRALRHTLERGFLRTATVELNYSVDAAQNENPFKWRSFP